MASERSKRRRTGQAIEDELLLSKLIISKNDINYDYELDKSEISAFPLSSPVASSTECEAILECQGGGLVMDFLNFSTDCSPEQSGEEFYDESFDGTARVCDNSEGFVPEYAKIQMMLAKTVNETPSVPKTFVSSILKILRTHSCFSNFPSDYRSLLNTRSKFSLFVTFPGTAQCLLSNLSEISVHSDQFNLFRALFEYVWMSMSLAFV